MSEIAIRVENLGKMYRIGGKQEKYKALRDILAEVLSSPFRRANSLFRGEAYGAAGLEETIWALKEVSFEVKRGEVVGVIGRNGAGKSTLLKVLSRITEPTEGFVEVYGRIGALLEVGTGFHPELTGRENIYLNGAILGMSRHDIERKFDEIVDFSGVEKFIDTPVKYYSSGMGLRLGFAVAAHLEPQILVVDEVLAVGDAEFQKKCLGKMQDVAGEGRTVIFVSHNTTAISALCPVSLLLISGHIAQLGETSAIIASYLSSRHPQSTSLSNRSDRTGNRIISFENIWLKNQSGEITNSVSGKEDITFFLQYSKADLNVPLDNVHFSILISDMHEQRITSFTTLLTGQGFSKLPDSGVVSCRIASLPLAHGKYTVHLWNSVKGVTSDYIEDVFQLTIEPTDYFNTGIMLDKRKHGLFVVPHVWEQADRKQVSTWKLD